MYLGLGMSRADCAKFFHVTERTLHNWERGCCAIPYAAYRLLRKLSMDTGRPLGAVAADLLAFAGVLKGDAS